MRKRSGLELRKCTALLAISILIIITAAGSPGVHVFHLRAGEMQSTYCNSEMHIENVQKILVLATMLLLLHLTARRRKTKRSPAETRGHCCRRRRRLKWIQLKIWQRLHFDFPSRILSSNAFIIYQPATGSKQQTETANCNSIPQTHAAVVNDEDYLPPPAARCIPLGVDSETTAATSHAKAQDPDANCGAR